MKLKLNEREKKTFLNLILRTLFFNLLLCTFSVLVNKTFYFQIIMYSNKVKLAAD